MFQSTNGGVIIDKSSTKINRSDVALSETAVSDNQQSVRRSAYVLVGAVEILKYGQTYLYIETLLTSTVVFYQMQPQNGQNS